MWGEPMSSTAQCSWIKTTWPKLSPVSVLGYEEVELDIPSKSSIPWWVASQCLLVFLQQVTSKFLAEQGTEPVCPTAIHALTQNTGVWARRTLSLQMRPETWSSNELEVFIGGALMEAHQISQVAGGAGCKQANAELPSSLKRTIASVKHQFTAVARFEWSDLYSGPPGNETARWELDQAGFSYASWTEKAHQNITPRKVQGNTCHGLKHALARVLGVFKTEGKCQTFVLCEEWVNFL